MIIDGIEIGCDRPTYVIAEISANHNGKIENAEELVRLAKDCGANAVKLQTYTPDTLTLRSFAPAFKISGDNLWRDRYLYDLYNEAYMPWEWQPRLFELAREININCFSTPFDDSAVEFLEGQRVPAYKIASFELVDVGLIKRVARTRKPVIMSTGMATLSEIEEAVAVFRANSDAPLALLKCTSAYPASPAEINLRTISHMADAFDLVVGLSDHTLGVEIPVAAVALGATIIEKHFTRSRRDGGPDSAFSLEPDEFRAMVKAIRNTKEAVGDVCYSVSEREKGSRQFRRSLFVSQPVKKGECYTLANVRSVRPSNGLHPRYLDSVLGRRASRDVTSGTALTWELVA